MLQRAQYWAEHLTLRGLLEIGAHEGIVLETYLDSKNIKTWSVGITNASGHNVDRYIGKPSTLERALEIYVWLLRTRYMPTVVRTFGNKLITEGQFVAAVSFHWNTGRIDDASWVTHFLRGNITQAKANFMLWDKPSVIKDRREAERDLFFEDKWVGKTTMLMYSVNSNMKPVSPRPVNITAQLQAILDKLYTPEDVAEDAAANDRQSTTKRAVEVATVGTIAKGAEEQLKPVQDLSERVSEVSGIDVGLVILIIVLLAIAWVYRERIRKALKGKKALEISKAFEETPAEIVKAPVPKEEKHARTAL